MATQTTGAREPLVARRMLENAAVRLPALTAVIGPEEDSGIPAEIQRLRLFGSPGLDVPRRVDDQLRIGGQPEPARALPRLAVVRGELDSGAVRVVVRSGVDDSATRIDRRVVDAPGVEQRPLDPPPPAVVVPLEAEEPFACADEDQDGDSGSPPQRFAQPICTNDLARA
jgi:hypothetical protein